jgi:hypothetical protein
MTTFSSARTPNNLHEFVKFGSQFFLVMVRFIVTLVISLRNGTGFKICTPERDIITSCTRRFIFRLNAARIMICGKNMLD